MSDTRQALEEAFRTVFPPPPNAHLGIDVPALEAHTQIVRRFRRFLDAEAWTDAAMMLISDWSWIAVRYIITKAMHEIGEAGLDPIKELPNRIISAALEACLKARENGDG